MQFPNDVQAAVLLSDPVSDLEGMVRDFIRVADARHGIRFNVPESRPGVIYRLFGGDSVTVTFEAMAQPGNMAVFEQALGSAITGQLCPDVRERLAGHRAMILVNVTHGVMGGVMRDPQFAGLFEQIGMRVEGASLPEFKQRLELCALAARIACDASHPVLVHWTQSNQLLKPEVFDAMAGMDVPGPLHVHPWLFGERAAPGEEQAIGLRTFGMRHFIGREVVIEPHTLPWAANYDTVLAFLRVATVPNGYVIPDGDCFGPEDRSLSYKVLWRDAEDGDVPLCELVPLMHREYGFVSPDYVSPENRIDDRAPPLELMPADDEEKMALVNDWREKRALAEGIGGSFEVKSAAGPPPAPPAPRDPGPPSISGTGLRARLFGGNRAA